MVMRLPVSVDARPEALANTADATDAESAHPDDYRNQHLPHVKGIYETVHLRPGSMELPRLDS